MAVAADLTEPLREPCVWVMDEGEVEANTASFSLKEHCVIFLKGCSERTLRHFPYRVI